MRVFSRQLLYAKDENEDSSQHKSKPLQQMLTSAGSQYESLEKIDQI